MQMKCASVMIAATLAVCGSALVAELGGCGKKNAAPVATNAKPGEAIRSAHSALGATVTAAGSGDSDALTADLKSHAREIEQLMEAVKSPECGFEVDYSPGLTTMLPHLSEARGLCRVLSADARRLSGAGDLDGAAKRVAAIFRIAGHVTCKAQTVIELLVGVAVAQTGADLVRDHPAISKAAWKTDIQDAMAAVQQPSFLNGDAIVRADMELMIRSLREGKMMKMEGIAKDWSTASQAEREAAAGALTGVTEEYVRAWKLPDGAASAAQLDAIATRAQKLPGGELLSALGRARKAIDKVRASVKTAEAALAK